MKKRILALAFAGAMIGSLCACNSEAVDSSEVSSTVSAVATATPTTKPTATPTAKPTATPTAKPTATPTPTPTPNPTATPTPIPTPTPHPDTQNPFDWSGATGEDPSDNINVPDDPDYVPDTSDDWMNNDNVITDSGIGEPGNNILDPDYKGDWIIDNPDLFDKD